MNKERYNRQLILEGFGETAQKRLAASSVLVIGAGGLGCPVLQYLTAAGTGKIGVADDDVISLSNLPRQILYSTGDIGKLKVDIADRQLRMMNPEVHIETYPFRLERNNIMAILSGYELIVDVTDNFETRYLINDACVLLKKPLIFAAVSGFEGQLAIFNTGPSNQAINYRDLFATSPQKGEIPNCSENGVLGIAPGIIGTMAAAEAIKLITGIGNPLINKLFHYNLLTTEAYEIKLTPSGGYQIPETQKAFLQIESNTECALDKKPVEITADELKEWQGKNSTLIIDIREDDEKPFLDVKTFIKAPLSGFKAFLTEGLKGENIVLICQSGRRCAAAAELIYQQYGNSKNIYSLRGGISRWPAYF